MPVIAVPGLTPTSPTMVVVAPVFVTVEPARIEKVPAEPSVAEGTSAVTFTVAKPEMAPLVALMVFENVPGTAPAVNKPEPALMAPPPATTDHVGVIGTTLSLASLPVATNCCVPLTTTVAGFGVTVIVANGPGLAITVT